MASQHACIITADHHQHYQWHYSICVQSMLVFCCTVSGCRYRVKSKERIWHTVDNKQVISTSTDVSATSWNSFIHPWMTLMWESNINLMQDQSEWTTLVALTLRWNARERENFSLLLQVGAKRPPVIGYALHSGMWQCTIDSHPQAGLCAQVTTNETD